MILFRLLIFLLIFACFSSEGQIVVKDWENELDSMEFRQLSLNARDIINSKNNDFRLIVRADIFPMGGAWYLTMEGMFDVYKWEDQKWNNLYDSKYWGYNFASLKFIYNHTLHSYGGSGFWKEHGEIIQFYMHAKEWDILHASNGLPSGLGLPGFHELFILKNDSLLIFNFKNEELSSFKIPQFKGIIPLYVNKKVIESKNYALAINYNQILLDKRNRNIYQRPRGAFIFIHGQYDGYYHVIGDSVVVYNDNLEFEMAELINAEMNTYSQVFPSVDAAGMVTHIHLKYYIIGFALLLLVTGVFYSTFKRKNKTPVFADLQDLVEKLLQNAGEDLSSDALDQTLDIPEYLSPENARYKRSKLVNEINDYYRLKYSGDLISRIKDPEDKRKFIYRISA